MMVEIYRSLVMVLLSLSALLISIVNVIADGKQQQQPSQVEAVCFADGTCRTLTTHVPVTTTKTSFPSNYSPIDHCGVYMAPSTLGEDTNMGIYAGKDFHMGDLVPYPEIAVPLLFREWGQHTAGYQDDGVLWDRYIWEGSVVQLHPYDNTNIEKSKSVFVPGVGCTINSVLDMNNILSVYTSEYDSLSLRRHRDAGVGAFSPYHNSETKIAVDYVQAGSELFANYGDSWIPEIEGAQIAFKENLNQAEDFLVDHYYPFIQRHSSLLTADMKQALYEFTTQTNYYSPLVKVQQFITNLPRNVPWKDIEQEIIKKQKQQAKEKERKKLIYSKPKPDEHEDDPELVVKDFMRKQSIRDVKWLQERGYCQDHIKPGKSTIPQAGRGAFASRDLPVGTVVGFSPLIHIGIHGRDIFTVEIPYPDGNKRKQYDLIINYSFGHANSTLLLTPYGGMVNYINHASSRTVQKPNVVLRWPNRELISHKENFLFKTPLDLKNTIDKIGLSWEYVAIRDIKEGEEIFLDYGVEWEQAWNHHVQTWKPYNISFDSHYIHSSEWIETTYRTLEELEKNPYPPNLETLCFESYTTHIIPNEDNKEEGNGDDNHEYYSYHEWIDLIRPDTIYRVHCNVLERNDPIAPDQNVTYTVELLLQPDKSSEEEEEEEENSGETMVRPVVVHKVPKEGIILTDKVFTADWLLPNAFRHEIMIPDDIMPKAWLNGPPLSKME